MLQVTKFGGKQGPFSAMPTTAVAPGKLIRSMPGRGEKTSVVLVDPRPLTRASVVVLLTRMARDFVVSPVSSVAELADGEPLGDVQLVIFNVGAALLSDAWVSAELNAIAKHVPCAPLILLSDTDDVSQVAKALLLGVRGYIPTTFSPAVAVGAMRFVHVGGTFIPANVVQQSDCRDVTLVDPGGAANIGGTQTILTEVNRSARARASGNAAADVVQSLPPRQREVLRLMCEGKPNKIIAHTLGMQEGTVKVHIRQIMKKVKATNRTEVAFFASRHCAETKSDP